jgi:lysophospholipase L1-like esterase
MIGTNDLARGASASEVVGGIEAIVERLKQDSPDSEVYLQSVLPRAADYRERVEAVNARLAEVAGEMGVGWIDLYPSFLDPDTGAIRAELSNDALHLLGPGYAVWKEGIEPLVRAGTDPGVELPAEEVLAPEPAPPGAEEF